MIIVKLFNRPSPPVRIVLRVTASAKNDVAPGGAEVAKLQQPEQFGFAFTRTDDAYRGAYELLQTGKMPESESMFGRLLNSMLGEGKEGVLRTQRIDGSKLPEFDVVRRYLGEWRHIHAELDGHDLKGLGVPRGPVYRDILGALRAGRLDGEIATREDEVALVRRLYPA